MRRAMNGHYVSSEEMLKTFGVDDLEALRLVSTFPLIEFGNEVDGMEHARRIADEIAQTVISNRESRKLHKPDSA